LYTELDIFFFLVSTKTTFQIMSIFVSHELVLYFQYRNSEFSTSSLILKTPVANFKELKNSKQFMKCQYLAKPRVDSHPLLQEVGSWSVVSWHWRHVCQHATC